ncbi:PD-(D/E)XK nuclease-like domain-containing protein [Nocardia asiatica]|uniref:PD-(D/E)XK nuclease-like domain-containing protein n=1 Tax=Nocardia asiatica TaxID=209252 RepID=UPI002457DEB2|nr:PD-(D/E)XK nuclease-like domain-containing protein [Nocardia asiatica]
MTAPFERGLYRGVDDRVYHADPALSSSGARTIAMRSPRDFWEDRHNGRPPNRDLDFGHAAHRYLLGTGSELEIVEADSWRSDAAKAARDAAYAAGRVPLLPEEDEQAQQMAAVVLQHPLAGPLFAEGEAELSGWWPDPETGVMLRFRADWMRRIKGRLVIVDYKTSKYTGLSGFNKSLGEFGYFMQQPFYIEGARVLDLDPDPDFIFVSQCKTPPYRVTVARLEREDIALGQALNRYAIRRFADCLAADDWPDDSDQIHTAALPRWARYQAEEILS